MGTESKAYSTHLSHQRRKVVVPLFHPHPFKLLFWVQVSVRPDNNDSYRLQTKAQTRNVWELNNEIMTPKHSQTPASLRLPRVNQTVRIVHLASCFNKISPQLIITRKTEIQRHTEMESRCGALRYLRTKISYHVTSSRLLNSPLS